MKKYFFDRSPSDKLFKGGADKKGIGVTMITPWGDITIRNFGRRYICDAVNFSILIEIRSYKL